MKKILMIEDDATLQKLYKEALQNQNLLAIEALTGKDGLEKAAKENPDVIVLDIMLPGGMNGFDVMGQIKRDPKLSSIPILILTNLDSEKNTALSLGAADYIVKTNTSMDQVVEKIKTLASTV